MQNGIEITLSPTEISFTAFLPILKGTLMELYPWFLLPMIQV